MTITINGTTGVSLADGSVTNPIIRQSGSNTGLFFANTGVLALSTNGVESMRISNTGQMSTATDTGLVMAAYAARAWVNFNGVGTVSIRGSGNVSSITDLSVGGYQVNFATAMPDANYTYSHAYSNEVNVQHGIGFLYIISASSISVAHYSAQNSANTMDKSYVFIAVFR